MPENEDAPDTAEQLDQLAQSDSLVHRGVEDPLDEGYTAPDNWSPAQGYGNTPEEMKRGETIDQRIAQEEPEEDPKKLKGSWNPHSENRQVGSQRAGRLSAPDGKDGGSNTVESVAQDEGISGGAASAEEAAMHIISEDDLQAQGDDDGDSDE